MNDEVKGYLDEQDPELVKKVLSNPRAFITIYNRMCRKCKQLVQQNSKRPMDDYCIRCKVMIGKVLR